MLSFKTTLNYLTKQCTTFFEKDCITYGCRCQLQFNPLTFNIQVPKLQSKIDHWLEKSANFSTTGDMSFFDESEVSQGSYKNLVMEYTNVITLAYEAFACHKNTKMVRNTMGDHQPIVHDLPITTISSERLNTITSSTISAMEICIPGAIRSLKAQTEILIQEETLLITLDLNSLERKVTLVTEQPTVNE